MKWNWKRLLMIALAIVLIPAAALPEAMGKTVTVSEIPLRVLPGESEGNLLIGAGTEVTIVTTLSFSDETWALVSVNETGAVGYVKMTELTELTSTAAPTAAPTPEPTPVPTPEPTATPTPKPTATPTPKPTATPKLETAYKLANSLTYNKGITTVSWTYEGTEKAKYVVGQVIDNGSAEQSIWIADDVSSTRATTGECIPGKRYHIEILDSMYSVLAEKDYDMPAPVKFEDGKLKDVSVKVKMELRSAPYGTWDYKKVNKFSAAKIQEDLKAETTWYGVKYQMQMPQLAKPRTFFVTLAFESPDGFLYVENCDDVTFDRVDGGYQTIWWNLIGGNFFRALYRMNEKIPSGKYKAILFWDGMLVNESSFTVDK